MSEPKVETERAREFILAQQRYGVDYDYFKPMLNSHVEYAALEVALAIAELQARLENEEAEHTHSYERACEQRRAAESKLEGYHSRLTTAKEANAKLQERVRVLYGIAENAIKIAGDRFPNWQHKTIEEQIDAALAESQSVCPTCSGKGEVRVGLSDIPGSLLNDGITEMFSSCNKCNGSGKAESQKKEGK